MTQIIPPHFSATMSPTNGPAGASIGSCFMLDGSADSLKDRVNGYDLSLQAGVIEGYVEEGYKPLTGLVFNGNTRLWHEDPTGLQITGAVTYEMLLRLTDISQYANLISIEQGGSESAIHNFLWGLRVRDDGAGHEFSTLIEYGAGTNENHQWTDYAITTDRVYLTITRNAAGKVYRLYINGLLVQTITFTNAPTGGTDSDLHIGGDPNAVTGPHWSWMTFHGARISPEEWSPAWVAEAHGNIWHPGWSPIIGNRPQVLTEGVAPEYCLDIGDDKKNSLTEDGTGELIRDYSVASRARFRLTCRRGEWWADRTVGSLLHTVNTLGQAQRQVQAFCQQALQPMIDTDEIVSVTVVAIEEDPVDGTLAASVQIEVPEGEAVDLGLIPVGA